MMFSLDLKVWEQLFDRLKLYLTKDFFCRLKSETLSLHCTSWLQPAAVCMKQNPDFYPSDPATKYLYHH